MSILSQFKQSQNTDFPNVRPSLDLRFALAKKLDPRITFTRGSTGTYFGSDGILRTAGVNEPRFDHDPITGQSLGLLIEESRTNLLTSSIPQAGVWSSINTTLISNSEIAPDGTQTATLINSDLTYGAHYINLNSSVTTATNYTQTFFVKAGTTRFVQVAPSTGFAATTFANFELIGDGVIGTSTVNNASIQRFPNGWYRIRVTQISTSTTSGRMLLVLGTSLTNGRLPNNTPVLSCYVWGAQLEAGAFATSYIPTTASTVTRSADNAFMTGTNFSSWYNQSEGTLYSNISIIRNLTTDSTGSWSLDNSSYANGYTLFHTNTTSSRLSVRGPNTSSSGRSIGDVTNVDITKFKNCCIILPSVTNRILSCSNGNFSGIEKSFSSGVSLNRLNIGFNNIIGTPANNYLNGTISRLTYYPIQLTNQQLINLTS